MGQCKYLLNFKSSLKLPVAIKRAKDSTLGVFALSPDLSPKINNTLIFMVNNK